MTATAEDLGRDLDARDREAEIPRRVDAYYGGGTAPARPAGGISPAAVPYGMPAPAPCGEKTVGVSRAVAAQRGCRHWGPGGKFGTPDECGDCPARRGGGGQVARPQGTAVAVRGRELDGDRLLKDAYTALKHFAVWPSEAALVTAVLYAAHAHAKAETTLDDGRKVRLPVWQYEPRLFLTSAGGGSGKSWMARLIAKLCPNGKMLVEVNKPNLVRLIEEQATVVVSEMDVLVGSGKRSQWFTGIANASYEPDQATSRVQNAKRVEIPLMCPMILDGLETVITSTGVELRTLVSRCILIRVKRAPDGYRAPRFDQAAREVFKLGSQKLGAWMTQAVAEGIGNYVPEVPEGFGNRPAALWEPLLAVADWAGGNWPKRARQACEELESSAAVDEDGEREQGYRSALAAWASDAGDGAEDA